MDHLIAASEPLKVLAHWPAPRALPQDQQLEARRCKALILHSPALRLFAQDCSPHRTSSTQHRLSHRGGLDPAGPYEEQHAARLVDAGWGRRSAQRRRLETGVDMTRFPHRGPLASWAVSSPRWTTSPEPQRTREIQKGTVTWPPSPRDPPVRPARPDPRRAPATGGSPAAAANPNHLRARQHLSEVLPRPAATPGMRYEDLCLDYYDNRSSTRRPGPRALHKRAASWDYTLSLTLRLP